MCSAGVAHLLDEQRYPSLWKCCKDPKAHASIGLQFWSTLKDEKHNHILDELLDKAEAKLAEKPPEIRGPDAAVTRAQTQLSSAKVRTRTTKSKLPKCKLAAAQAKAVYDQATAE